MVRAKLKFRLHRAVIVLICLALLVALMQGPPGSARTVRSSAIRSWKNWHARSPSRSRSTWRRCCVAKRPMKSGLASCWNSLPTKVASSTPAFMTSRATWWRVQAKASRYAIGWRWTVKKRAVTSTSKLSSLSREKRPARLPAPDAGYPYLSHRSAAGR